MKRILTVLIALCALPLAAADPVVAVFDGQQITESEVIAPIEAQLREIRDAEYNLKREAVDRHVFALARKQLAAKEGITVEELWKREVEAKAGQPTDAEVDATFRQYRPQLPADEAQARQMVVDALRQRRMQERERAWRDEILAKAEYRVLLEPVRYVIPSLAGDAASGPGGTRVTITEFSDFQCPYCAQSQSVLDEVEKAYGDRVRVVFKQLPLDMHPQARYAAEASLCARDQGKFWELHDWLFANPRSINIEKLREVSPSLGIDAAKLESCLDAKTHAAAVEAQIEQAKALGVNSTPTFFVNGRKVTDRSFAAFSRMIDEELAKKQ